MKKTIRWLSVIFILMALAMTIDGQQTADEWQMRAIEIAMQGDTEGAKIAFDEAIRSSPNDATIPHIAGVTLAAKGDNEAAINYFDKAIRMNSNDDLSWLYKGDALQQQSRYNEAVKCYDKAINIYSESANTWSHRGNALVAQGKNREAIRNYDRALNINSSDTYSLIRKGDTLAAIGDYDDAILAFKKVIGIDSNNPEAYNNIGQALFSQEKYEEAIKWFDIAGKKNPDYCGQKCNAMWQLAVKTGGGKWYEKYRDCLKEAETAKSNEAKNQPPQSQSGKAYPTLEEQERLAQAYIDAVLKDHPEYGN